MTLQNRVDPWGQLNSHPSKSAALMGNRGGKLHNSDKKIIRQYENSSWITCNISHKNIKREVFGNSYSELFFLDEATAFAAGHRPCWQCQTERHNQFKQVWIDKLNAGIKLSVKVIDKKIHQDRLTLDKNKKTFEDKLCALPVGTFFEYESKAIVIFNQNHYLVWSFDGYTNRIKLSPDFDVKVLTPRSLVQIFSEGFTPFFHSSAH